MQRNHVLKIQKHDLYEWLLPHTDLRAQQPYLEFVEQLCVLLYPIGQNRVDVMELNQDQNLRSVSPFVIAAQERKA